MKKFKNEGFLPWQKTEDRQNGKDILNFNTSTLGQYQSNNRHKVRIFFITKAYQTT